MLSLAIESFLLPFVFSFNKCFQVIEATGPKHAVLLDPGVDRPQWFGVECVDTVSPFAMLPHQVGPAKQAQVFRNCGPRNGKGVGDLPGRL